MTDALLESPSPYVAYVYGYPHKTAYRPLDAPVALADLWRDEARDALFLYVHVPFCEMRCGFCNLFTQARPRASFARQYVDALERQARAVRDSLGENPRFASAAIGGGTPTQLEAGELARVFDACERTLGADLGAIPVACETSPETAQRDRLTVLRERGVDRISIGVQSFVEAETRAIHRPQDPRVVTRALDAIRATGFATLNIDLMYGLPGQTVDSWLASLRAALAYRPEEIYLYPLYVRPLTRMGRAEPEPDDARVALYREGRALLQAEGYAQRSMRMFVRASSAHRSDYVCQRDGMVGLGCGARSYTSRLHYSFEWAVGARGVKEILEAYVARDERGFAHADYGFALDDDEQRRRYAILSLLGDEGLDLEAYRARFGGEAYDQLSELATLERRGFSQRESTRVRLTADGLERSDAIGPWLFSRKVRARMEGFALR